MQAYASSYGSISDTSLDGATIYSSEEDGVIAKAYSGGSILRMSLNDVKISDSPK